MFHFNGPTCRAEGSCPRGLHYYFDFVAETEFSFTSVDDLLEIGTSCRVTRGGSGQHRAFLGVNNFLSIPSKAKTPTINALEFVRPRVEACAAANDNRAVSFLYVDFWSIGDVLEYSRMHNSGLGANANTNVGTASTTAKAGNSWLRY